jgi:hypothetical protein
MFGGILLGKILSRDEMLFSSGSARTRTRCRDRRRPTFPCDRSHRRGDWDGTSLVDLCTVASTASAIASPAIAPAQATGAGLAGGRHRFSIVRPIASQRCRIGSIPTIAADAFSLTRNGAAQLDRHTAGCQSNHTSRYIRSKATLRRGGRGQASRSDRRRRLGLDAGRLGPATRELVLPETPVVHPGDRTASGLLPSFRQDRSLHSQLRDS